LEIAINDTLFNQMTAQLQLQTEELTANANSGFQKLAVQWLNQVQFSNQTFVVADSLVLRNRQLLKPANS